jgi:hypothetical protein
LFLAPAAARTEKPQQVGAHVVDTYDEAESSPAPLRVAGCPLWTCQEFCASKDRVHCTNGLRCPATVQVVTERKTCTDTWVDGFSIPSGYVANRLSQCERDLKVMKLDNKEVKKVRFYDFKAT